MSGSDPGFLAAVEEAKQGQKEGGVPIGKLTPLSLPLFSSHCLSSGVELMSVGALKTKVPT